MSERRDPMWARCECGHRWVLAYLPMDLRVWCQVARGARCPMCGSRALFLTDPPDAAEAREQALRKLPTHRGAPSLDQCGDVLTDRDLALLVQRPPSWPARERSDAKRARRAPNLPAEIGGGSERTHRYRKADVAQWLTTGSRRRAGRP